jgi:two-component system, OmpR family, sensor histidine kinase KdpD
LYFFYFVIISDDSKLNMEMDGSSTRLQNDLLLVNGAPCISMMPSMQNEPQQDSDLPRNSRARIEIPERKRTGFWDPVGGSARKRLLEGSFRQYAAAFGIFIFTMLLNLWLEDVIGYQAVALVYLLAVVVLALFADRGPIIFGTTLTAFGWAFLAAPPRFSFHIYSFYDKMMVATYFVVGLTIGQLTTRLRLQREAAMKSKLLAESERLGRTLLNSVSHELRTPIAAVTTASHELLVAGALTPLQQKLVGEIESAVARLNRVVKSLLNAARVQSGLIKPNIDWCEIADLVRAALDEVEPMSVQHPIKTRIDPGLPLVKMDFVLTQQALDNLLMNAIMHTPPGTEIEVTARLVAHDLVLEVEDRGEGLSPDHLERVFDVFYRASNARPGGTGLGLAIVKGFIEAQGGSVKAANRLGGGAVFTISLPASDRPDLPEETP